MDIKHVWHNFWHPKNILLGPSPCPFLLFNMFPTSTSKSPKLWNFKPYAIKNFINNLHLFLWSIICIHHQFIKLKINNITSLKCNHNACNVAKVGNYLNSFGFACIPDQHPSLFYVSTTSVKSINRMLFQMTFLALTYVHPSFNK